MADKTPPVDLNAVDLAIERLIESHAGTVPKSFVSEVDYAAARRLTRLVRRIERIANSTASAGAALDAIQRELKEVLDA